MKNRRRSNQAGITLIEMLVVVTIIALFAAVVVVRLMPKVDTAKRTAARADINGFMTALGTYKMDTGNYPTTEQGLKALREKPEGVNGWQGPYLTKDVPKDPWRNDFVYKFPGDHEGCSPCDEPDIISYGGDGKPGGDRNDADIESWKND